jgi:prepilin-type N-terminal cleavage/methylation domain-containing protein
MKKVSCDRCPVTGEDRHRSPVTGHRSPRKSGLTLVEVLMALVILGTGLVVLIAAASRCIAVVRKVRNFETSRELLAQVELENPIQLEEKIEDANKSGSFSHPYSGYTWQREVEFVGHEEDGLFEVRTTIGWSERGENVSEKFVTYVYAPEAKLQGSTGGGAP